MLLFAEDEGLSRLLCCHRSANDAATRLDDSFLSYAEDEGFKPPIPVMGIPDFESSAFGHSANLPLCLQKYYLFFIPQSFVGEI